MMNQRLIVWSQKPYFSGYRLPSSTTYATCAFPSLSIFKEENLPTPVESTKSTCQLAAPADPAKTIINPTAARKILVMACFLFKLSPINRGLLLQFCAASYRLCQRRPQK